MDIRALEQQPDTMEEYARSFRDEVWPQLSDRVCQLYIYFFSFFGMEYRNNKVSLIIS